MALRGRLGRHDQLARWRNRLIFKCADVDRTVGRPRVARAALVGRERLFRSGIDGQGHVAAIDGRAAGQERTVSVGPPLLASGPKTALNGLANAPTRLPWEPFVIPLNQFRRRSSWKRWHYQPHR